MPQIWVISDTHFNHSNILNFEDSTGKPIRPFSSAEEMNEVMIDNWNSLVQPGDKVYHLGDVLFGQDKQDWMNTNWPRLNGKKNLIVGNHDNIKMMSVGGWFKQVYFWRILSDLGLILSHIPLREDQFRSDFNGGKKKMINVHGHIHQNPSPDGPYKCVCVEQTGYKPVPIEELIDGNA